MKLTSDQQIGLSLLFLVVFFTSCLTRECESRRKCANDMLQRSGLKIEHAEIEAVRRACAGM